MSPQELQPLIDLIGSHYVFNKESYSQLEGKTDKDEILMFAVNHSVLHMNKSIGTLATACEAYDHKGITAVDKQQLEVGVVKMLINTLKLAEELGMTGQQLAERVFAFYKK